MLRSFALILICLATIGSAQAASIAPQKSVYVSTDRVVGVWSTTAGEISTGAWVGVFNPSQTNTDYGSQGVRWAYVATGATSGEMTLGPLAAGSYEFRLFKDSAYTVVARSAAFTVANAGTSSFSSATSELTIPEITINGSLKYTGVQLRLKGYSELKVNDSRATSNAFNTTGNILTLTSVLVDGVEYKNVYLAGLSFDVLAGTASTTTTTTPTNLTPVQGLAKLAGTYNFTVNQTTSAQFAQGSSIAVTITSDGRIQFSAAGFNIAYGDNTIATRVIGTPGSGSESYQLFSADNMQQIGMSLANGSPASISFTTLTTGFVVAGRR